MALASGATEAAPTQDDDALLVVNGEPVRLRDLDLFIFTDDRAGEVAGVIGFMVEERLVRQEMSRKAVSVARGDVDDFIKDLDRDMKAAGSSLADSLAGRGLDMEFFRRQAETTVGLYRLVGGQGRPYSGMKEPVLKARMEELPRKLAAAGKVETDSGRLAPEVAATVNGEVISAEDAGRLTRLRMGAEDRAKRLDRLLNFVLVRQEFRRRRLELTADDIDYHLKLVSATRSRRAGDRDVPLEEMLRALGVSVDQLRRQHDFRGGAMLSKMVRDEVTEEEMKALFEREPVRFGNGVPRVSQILLRTVGDDGRPASAEAAKKAHQRILELKARLADGADFAELAGKFSEDPGSAARGGDAGFMDNPQANDPLAQAAFSLKIAETSPPILSGIGWHILRVTDIRRVSFGEVRGKVLSAVTGERCARLRQQLRAAAKVERGRVSP